MANLNKVLLIGRLTRDPEVRYTPGGVSVTEFGLAVNRNYTMPNGEKREETCFVDVNVWGKRGEIAKEYLKKGRQVFIEGRLDFRSWEAQDGQKRSKLRVVVDTFQFLDGGRREEAEMTGASAAEGEYGEPPPMSSTPPRSNQQTQQAAEDDLPF
jgi:single-strand DNA-binding protein